MKIRGKEFGVAMKKYLENNNLSIKAFVRKYRNPKTGQEPFNYNTVESWIYSRSFPTCDHREKLIKFGIFDKVELARMRRNYKGEPANYVAFNYGECLARNISAGTINDSLEEIFEQYPVPGDPDQYGAPDNWLKIYDISPDTIFILLDEEKNVVGNCHYVAVDDEVYDSIIRGDNANLEISENQSIISIKELGPGCYNLYLVDMFIGLSEKNNASISALFDRSYDYLLELANRGIYFSRIATHASTDDAITTCGRRGFRFRRKHSEHRAYVEPILDRNNIPADHPEKKTSIYEINFENEFDKRFFGYHEELRIRYEEQFKHA